jgi:hypothetical protein
MKFKVWSKVAFIGVVMDISSVCLASDALPSHSPRDFAIKAEQEVQKQLATHQSFELPWEYYPDTNPITSYRMMGFNAFERLVWYCYCCCFDPRIQITEYSTDDDTYMATDIAIFLGILEDVDSVLVQRLRSVYGEFFRWVMEDGHRNQQRTFPFELATEPAPEAPKLEAALNQVLCLQYQMLNAEFRSLVPHTSEDCEGVNHKELNADGLQKLEKRLRYKI